MKYRTKINGLLQPEATIFMNFVTTLRCCLPFQNQVLKSQKIKDWYSHNLTAQISRLFKHYLANNISFLDNNALCSPLQWADSTKIPRQSTNAMKRHDLRIQQKRIKGNAKHSITKEERLVQKGNTSKK